MSANSVIEINNLSFAYNGNTVLSNVNIGIAERDFVWIVGPNGGGKTTLLKLMLGLLQPLTGTVLIFGRKPEKVRSRIGYMPQQVHLDPQFPVTVFDVVLMGRLGSSVKVGLFGNRDKKAAESALDEVGLRDQKNVPFSDLSGGQQRRLLIARALACNPDLLLLDEPTANLDLKAEKELFRLLNSLHKRMTVVMVSHDPAFVSKFVERVICVNRTVSVHPTTAVDDNFMKELHGAEVRIVRHDRHLHQDDQYD